MVQIVWFKRDLRTRDHRPLSAASLCGPVLPLFIIEDQLLNAPDSSPRHWAFQRQGLTGLDQELRALGQPLVVRQGPPVAVLEELRQRYGTVALWAHEETGNGISYQRDRDVRRWAKSSGVQFTELPQNGVVRRLVSRDGWSKRWEERMAEPVTHSPSQLTAVGPLMSLPLPKLAAQDIWPSGTRAAGLALLDSFLSGRGFRYTTEMSSPVTAESACSRLSPFLAWGQLSMREIVQATRRRVSDLQGDRTPESKIWRQSLRSFDARLHWHCHFMQKLEDEPRIEFENVVRAYDGLREGEFSAERFEAWKAGRTGYPFVDACMRYLQETGWINFRMRAMLVSFASYHLWLHWRQPALYLAGLFLDYEPGIHYSQFQMQSGTSGINTIRIYSPTKQALDQDPAGSFIRRWVPELAAVPAEHVHQPWLQPESRGSVTGYPLPIVDHATAIALARQRISAIRRQDSTRAEAKQVVQRHGSRKAGGRRPAAKSKRAPQAPKAKVAKPRKPPATAQLPLLFL